MRLPTYFIASSDRPSRSEEAHDLSASVHAVDVFRIAEDVERFTEWIVTVDALGALQAFQADARVEFPQSLQSELAFQELSSSSGGRVLRLREFYLIGVRYLDQPAQAPGFNDPVQLYGTLYGPYRRVQDVTIDAWDGQLTVTRADLLDALVRGAPHAFRYPSASGENRNAPRCLHMTLPVDREDAIAEGRGVAFAYLMMPSELMLSDASNELLGSQMLYELLSALRHDLRNGHAQHPLCSVDLPVPSRPMLERQLQAEGYVIQGDQGIKQSGSSSSFTGLLASVFGVNEKRLQLPAEGRLEDFLRLAHVALQALPGWPTPRAVALRQREAPATPAPERLIPKPAAAPVEPERQVPPPPAKPEPRLKDAVRWKRPGSSARPDWMDDFANKPAQPPRKPQPKSGAKPETRGTERKRKPDWMKDFE